MARLANGTVTGQFDCNIGAIRVGDTVQCLADGLEYVVDGYCGIRNESGAAFKVKEWDPSKFRVVQSKVDGKTAEPETKTEQPPVAVTISPTLEDYADGDRAERPGAGRKPGGQRSEKLTITARVEPETRETLDRLKGAGFQVGEVIDAGVEFAGRLLLGKR